ncbi:hypothetical protein HOD05_03720 [Candidatus Woesearchaeota archaeon]|jgi:hypothetical protein|nr:hypothetical protein [Candidatus Woesearchaeota archaeon]MBT4150661.1 hypothetical protein [Candidatus Woesearchaeota archaeon]MBT4247879.1 hypothetical protein [Candidatus Woesearchaeota archaeon]MBT4434303.1 hypothetical protein [Candidatus Woesearchaeota archaeon]MBT7331765.1 hypothetical protein [Candidatus Woesearchaeota archaeon]
MNLQEIRKEARSLPSIKENLQDFQKNWIKPVKSNTNKHLPFLQDMNPEEKKELNQKMQNVNTTLKKLQDSDLVTQRLTSHARHLIELKLTHFQGNEQKSKMITKSFISDDVMNIKRTITEVKSFNDDMDELSQHYEDVNELLQKSLSLEEMLFFMEMPHYKYLSSLKKTAEKHKKIVSHIGRHFVKLAKVPMLKKTPHK